MRLAVKKNCAASHWRRTHIQPANGCRSTLGRVKAVSAGTTNRRSDQRAVLVVLAFLVLCTFGPRALARQPLFDAYQKVIVLDPGHGGDEVGARGPDGTTEKEVALAAARLIAAELDNEYKVVLTRSDDYRVDIDNRTALANNLQASVFISLHAGGSYAHRTSGTVIYYYQSFNAPPESSRKDPSSTAKDPDRPIPWNRVQEKHSADSRILAELTDNCIRRLETVKNTRIQAAPLAVLEGADMPAILIELGYLTNPAEEKALQSRDYLTELARAISAAVREFITRKGR